MGPKCNRQRCQTFLQRYLSLHRRNYIKIRNKIDRLSSYLGLQNGFDGFLSFVEDFNTSLDIPNGLLELGVLEKDLDRIINGALKDPSKGGNPISLNAKNLGVLLTNAM